jgi:hypothetical protein
MRLPIHSGGEPEFSFLKSAWKSLGLFTSLKKTYLMSFKDWQLCFCEWDAFAGTIGGV